MLIYYVDLKPLGLIGLSFIVLLFPPRPLIFSSRKTKNKKIYSGKKKREKKVFSRIKIDESSHRFNKRYNNNNNNNNNKNFARDEKLPRRRSVVVVIGKRK